MKQARVAACGLGLVLIGLVAFCKADPAPAPQPPSINQAIDQRQLESINGELDEEKRAWQNLHGGWGKRAWQDMNSAWGKRAWQNLHGGWGKRGWQDMNSAWGKRGWKDMNSAWGKRAWNNLHGGWGKRDWSSLHGGWGKRDNSDIMELLDGINPQAIDGDMYDSSYDQYIPLHQILNNNPERLVNDADDQDVEKKSWSSLHGTWGKRSSDKWSNFKGSWGKREPGWNNLKGLWGKRSTLDSMDDSPSEYSDRRDE